MSKYITTVIDVCPVKTKLNDSEKDKGCAVIFEVPESYENHVVKMEKQFKTDGYLVEKVSTSRPMQEDY